MATKRYISTSFWNDTWVQEELDPNEKLLYLYLLTSPLANIAGIYEVATRRIVFDTGIKQNKIKASLKKFEDAKKVRYDGSWVILINWPKYQNITRENNVKIGIDRVLSEIPDDVFIDVVKCGYQFDFLPELQRYQDLLKDPNKPLDSPLQGSGTTLLNLDFTLLDLDSTSLNPQSTHPSDELDSDNIDDSDNPNQLIPYKTIIEHLNLLCQTNYKASSKTTQKLIRDRWNEGFRVDDFKIVIRKKSNEWLNTEYASYLRPQTLFGTKFESYLNQLDKPKKTKNQDHLLATMAAVENFYKENDDE